MITTAACRRSMICPSPKGSGKALLADGKKKARYANRAFRMVPKAGLEPARLTPLPPQDSVSTSSTTSATTLLELGKRIIVPGLGIFVRSAF